MNITATAVLGLAFLNLAIIPARAQLAQYTFGTEGSPTVAPTTVHADLLSASNVIQGAGLQGTYTGATTFAISGVSDFDANSGNTRPGYFVRAIATATSEGGAVSDNDYIEFVLTPDTLVEMNFTSLSFDFFMQNVSGSGSATQSLFLRSSLDGFASTVGTISRTQLANSGNTSWTDSTRTFDLSAPLYQAVDQAVAFRLFFYRSTAAGIQEGTITRLDNFSFNGSTVVIPEPSTYALLGLGLGALIWLRRRTA